MEEKCVQKDNIINPTILAVNYVYVYAIYENLNEIQIW